MGGSRGVAAGVWAVLGGSLAFIGATAALQGVSLAPVPLCMIGLVALVATLYLLPTKRRGGRDERSERASTAATPTAASIPRWDLPARMLIATGFVVLLTGIAPALGPHLTGLIAPFPVFATILAAFAQRQSGPAAAVGVLHGLLLGLFSFAAFFLTLARSSCRWASRSPSLARLSARSSCRAARSG